MSKKYEVLYTKLPVFIIGLICMLFILSDKLIKGTWQYKAGIMFTIIYIILYGSWILIEFYDLK